jgi:hypothetical protein
VSFLLTWCAGLHAAEPRTEHTFKLSEGEAPPTGTLEDVAWLAGSWTGTAFGGPFEAVWTPPSAGSMVGLFKLLDGDEVNFYEILTLKVDDGRLGIKVKHFTKDFIAWEEKDEYTHFKLVRIDDNAVHFSGISFYRVGEDRMEVYLVMRSGEILREERLTYQRVNP